MINKKSNSETYHVLFVDDEIKQIVNYIKKYSGSDANAEIVKYGKNNYQFHFCDSISEAKDILRFALHPIQAVVLDYFFPMEKHDGLWLLEQIVAMSPDIPVIMLTQHFQPESAHEAGVLQADKFLDKAIFLNEEQPEDFEFLLKEIQHSIFKKKQQPELHDRKHLSEADKYANEGYDEGEQKFPATVAYYLFENEKILNLIKMIKSEKGKVHICDVGCGTGRIEEMILREFSLENDSISILSLDFSGRMLKRLHDKNLHKEERRFKIERASAEKLRLIDDCSFDLVILGFGLPSYTKFHLSLEEASRICRLGGYALLSVYNEESAIYEAIKNTTWENDERPVAAIGNPETGKLNVGGSREFDCETFTINQFERLLKRQKFKIEETSTFPTLHVSFPLSFVEGMPDSKDSIPVPGFSFCTTFSRKLYELDKSFSRACPGRGHYIITIAKKH